MGNLTDFCRHETKIHGNGAPGAYWSSKSDKLPQLSGKRLKALLSAIGANGSNLRAMMESMQR